MSSQDYIPIAKLPSFLGINPGENLMVSSDITRLAVKSIRAEGKFDPGDFIDVFLDAIGQEGTLIIPAFNFNLEEGETFNSKNTVPVTGALAEVALKRNDFRRTRHPLHSFLVWGKYAGHLTGIDNISSFGPDSPFAFFKERDILMLMIGTTVTDAFTFVHHVEEMEGVRYRKLRKMQINCIYTGEKAVPKEVHLYKKKPGWTMNLASLESVFREKGVLKESSFNGVPCTQVRLGEAFPIIRDDILTNNAHNISRFSLDLFFREFIKKTLSSLHLYQTLTDKITHGPGPR